MMPMFVSRGHRVHAQAQEISLQCASLETCSAEKRREEGGVQIDSWTV